MGVMGLGKSILVKLLLWLYEWDSGDIFLDGVDLKKYFLGDLWCSVGLVS